MDLFAIDDSAQRQPTRDGMRPIVAVGGIHVPGSGVRDLESKLDALCTTNGFPAGDEFKWSPHRKSWQHKGLVGETRDAFNLEALRLAKEAGATGIVVLADCTARCVPGSETPEESVTLMFLERANAHLAGRQALVVFDRPGGNRAAEDEFLVSTIARLRHGTTYSDLGNLALALAADSKHSRLLQLADVVTSCTASYVAGETKYAPKIFQDGVLPLLRSDSSVIGGRGLKIHPDYR